MSRQILHIGVLVHDLEAAIPRWEKNFGFKLTHRENIDAEGIRTAMLSPNGRHGETGVELIEPMDQADMSNPIARRLAQSGEGFYHLAMTVDDVREAGQALRALAVTVIEREPATLGAALQGLVDPATCRQIVHPGDSNGILVELLQGTRT
jgi:lactoylglutathione lyase/methylmalonyl-CoA/ethylmalonyl-CoA epimerase